MVTSLTVPGTQNFVAIGLGVSAPQICDFAVTFDVTSFFFVLGGFFNKATAYTREFKS